MKKFFIILFFIFNSSYLFSEEYTISDKVEKDHLGGINIIRRFIRLNSNEILHREKAKMILFKEVNNIFQFWGGHIDILIQGVGKVDYVNNKGKYARKYSEDAVIYGLSKKFSHLYFYDSEIGISIEASNLFPELERNNVNDTSQLSQADQNLKEVINNTILESQNKLKIIQEQAEERKRQRETENKRIEEQQKQLERRYKYSGSLINILMGLIYD